MGHRFGASAEQIKQQAFDAQRKDHVHIGMGRTDRHWIHDNLGKASSWMASVKGAISKRCESASCMTQRKSSGHSAGDALVFQAIVARVQTMADNGLRVTLDLPEGAVIQAAQLMELKRIGAALRVTVDPAE